MPSSFSHAVAAVAFGRAYTRRALPPRFWVLTITCALVPDLDILGSRFGIGLDSMLGHRGITHSFFFALLLSGLVVLLAFRQPVSGMSRRRLLVYFFAVTASHAILDALVDGDWGVAFFAPFSSTRYFLPWRPIHSSPVGLGFFSSAGASVILNEIVWVCLPSLIVCLAPWLRERLLTKRREGKLDPQCGCLDQKNIEISVPGVYLSHVKEFCSDTQLSTPVLEWPQPFDPEGRLSNDDRPFGPGAVERPGVDDRHYRFGYGCGHHD